MEQCHQCGGVEDRHPAAKASAGACGSIGVAIACSAAGEASEEPRGDVFVVVADGSSLMMATERVTAVRACAEVYEQRRVRRRSYLTPSETSHAEREEHRP